MDCLIVVDMLKGFCRPGFPLSTTQSTLDLESFIVERIKSYKLRNLPVIFCCDSHSEQDPEFKQYPKHCMKGTVEAELVDTIAPLAKDCIVVEKTTLNPFIETNLNDLLQKHNCKTVELTGVYTDICIAQTAGELRNRGYLVTVPERGVMATESEKQTTFLSYMQTVFGVDIETGFWSSYKFHNQS